VPQVERRAKAQRQRYCKRGNKNCERGQKRTCGARHKVDSEDKLRLRSMFTLPGLHARPFKNRRREVPGLENVTGGIDCPQSKRTCKENEQGCQEETNDKSKRNLAN